MMYIGELMDRQVAFVVMNGVRRLSLVALFLLL